MEQPDNQPLAEPAGDGELVVREDLLPHVAHLTLARPSKLNAMGPELIAQLVDLVHACEDDPEVRAIVIRGAGRSFSVGADASAPARELSPADWRAMLLDEGWGQFLELWRSPLPTIVAVHGHCLGIGILLCNVADIVVAADDATFGWPALPFGGGILGPSSVWHVGIHRAKELSFQVGSTLTGTEAARYGLVNYSVPADQLEDDVAALAGRIATTPRDLLRLKKEAINQVAEGLGYTASMRLGASFGALAHHATGAEEAKALVAELGIKGAIDRYTTDAKPK